jgi:2-C-methyl-D-erythritol 2,4-cyclodiphosphate synthase
MKIGQGFDAHRLVPGQGIVLGGVHIPCEFGVQAHSDGDILLHACCDALLGALGQGDIGQHFPDSDMRYKDCDSRTLLRSVYAMLKAASFSVRNLDATIIAQAPRLSPYVRTMEDNIAFDLQVAAEDINVKATTTERLGFTGREEGIVAIVVVLLQKTS